MKYIKKSIKAFKSFFLKMTVFAAAGEVSLIALSAYKNVWEIEALILFPLMPALMCVLVTFVLYPVCLFFIDRNYQKTGNISNRVFDDDEAA
jgi:hypothetical protein